MTVCSNGKIDSSGFKILLTVTVGLGIWRSLSPRLMVPIPSYLDGEFLFYEGQFEDAEEYI